MIQKVLLPSYAELSSSVQVHVLQQWIWHEFSLAKTEQQKKNSAGNSKVVDLVASAPLIVCTDGDCHPCREIYDPRQEQSVQAILGTDAKFPDMEIYHDQERWLKFFHDDLRIASNPRASAILQAIDSLIAECQEKGVSAVRDRLQLIFNYIVSTENWNRLIQERTDEEKQDFTHSLIGMLSERYWLPAQTDLKQLSWYAAYHVPDDRLLSA